ncbi:MAG: peptide chain release factor N(5)-glutamine methyltransferase [Lachnospiraceae bacterium]|nr:peptide chain release factor N(5)-glutamine methyltransferase [Lachnospiraceae bacterium]MBO5144579.1 peptide chain release factor N(5)-glutamine methyltransferase [Lachnospiraceae bacterium]
MTYKELYEYGMQKLQEAEISEASLDARLLLEYICHTDRNELLVHGDRERSALEEQFYRMTIEQRAAHVPLQHITGEQEFMGLSFQVNEHTLIPRQDTEILVEEAMRRLGDGMRILDLCTGSGCIVLSLLQYSNECEGIGIDISGKALCVARENAERLGLDAVFLEGDLFSPLENFISEKTTDRLFDMIVSNPPYIETSVIDTLMPEVRDHEPVLALDGREDGLHFYRQIIAEAPAYMRKGAYLLFEIGCEQGEAVKTLMQDAGFLQIEIFKDYAGHDRVIAGRKADF